MIIIEVTNSIFFELSEFVSCQNEVVNKYESTSPSDGYYVEKFNGCVITLKNGRKVYADKVQASDVLNKLKNASDILLQIK